MFTVPAMSSQSRAAFSFQETFGIVLMYRHLCALIALTMVAQVVEASTFARVSLVCPFDGESFEEVLARSGTQFGQFLDLKPFGPVAAPWPIAKCPTSGFVMFKESFSEAELAVLRPYVSSDEYRQLMKTETNYYLAAKLQKVLNAPAVTLPAFSGSHS